MNLLEMTKAAAIKDGRTTSDDGKFIRKLPDGVTFRSQERFIDRRGSVRVLYDPRWNFHPAPLEYSYCFTVAPGVVKGWGLHEKHDDRYSLLKGQLELALYDVRPESSTCGQIFSIVLSEQNPGIINIPAGIWHADYNFGVTEALVINFPTKLYDHTDPDKWRLPIGSKLIPHSFGNATGG